jgi:phosphopantetheinyl transferase
MQNANTVITQVPIQQDVDLLSQQEIQLAPEKKRAQWLSGRIALKQALGHFTQRDVSYNKGIIQHEPTLYYSISHSKQAAVAAVSLIPVGIDIEQVKPVSDTLQRRYVNAGELELLHIIPVAYRPIALWTVKEAVAKVLWRGITMDLRSIKLHREQTLYATLDGEKYSISIDLQEQQVISLATRL